MKVIRIKSPREIELMRQAGKITAAARSFARDLVTPGVTTQKINDEVHKFIISHGAVPSFLGYNGFQGSVCISLNEEVIHGIPSKRRILSGNIVSIDLGAQIGGFHGDCACTLPCGETSPENMRLIELTRQSFFEGLKYARVGYRVSDISHAIQEYAESHGLGVVREYVGHGIGSKLHEPPEVPNFGPPGHGPRLLPGMTIAIEPMLNWGGAEIKLLGDGWTIVTADGSFSAHYENTILITDGEPEILTASEDM